ncbi:MAG: RdgB/HAM1 family non-canonical purine NTP pyrophosphatase [Candidatus Lokiarchaeota archaeon]|nr:RdgB/HAM1 family non-canonical purine NTP pyrophosphatase [Candidatus Lokiarchaeota archaeon]
MNEVKEDIFFITGNSSKYNEIQQLFKQETINYNLIQKDLKTIEIQAESIKSVAEFKINSVKDKLICSAFVEDAGFFVDNPLNGFPGVYSSYVMKTIGNKGILNLIENFEDSRAHFSAAIALYFKPLHKIFFFEGTVEGKVSNLQKGNHGFGFDPIFIPDEIPTKTFAELTTTQKNSISHRGKAWLKLIDFLRKN